MATMAHSPHRATLLGQLCFLPCLQEAQLHILYELILTQYQVSEKKDEKGMMFSLKEGQIRGNKAEELGLIL